MDFQNYFNLNSLELVRFVEDIVPLAPAHAHQTIPNAMRIPILDANVKSQWKSFDKRQTDEFKTIRIL